MKTVLKYDSKKELAKGLPYNPYLSEILLQRGLKDKDEIDRFINPSPTLSFDGVLKDEEKAVELIKEAVLNKEDIVIYTDYDADGAMAGVIGRLALEMLGANIFVYTNNKKTDGYGLCKTGIDKILFLYPNCRFIITADNGIAASDISYAKEKGFTVVVTDHHEQGAALPPADALVDAKRLDCESTYKDMCGAGLLLRIMFNLFTSLGKRTDELYPLTAFAAIATIADVVPLIGFNRDLVKIGLAYINGNECPKSLVVLKRVLNLVQVNAQDDIAFSIAPLINSVVRLTGDISFLIEAFCSSDYAFSISVFQEAKALNEKRKEITKEQTAIAREYLFSKYGKPENLPEALIVYGEEFDEGIVGIIAGNLKEEFNRPAFVFAKNEDAFTGSARSTDFINIKALLDSLSDLLVKYGGHAKAAGLTLKKENLLKFEEKVIYFVKESSTPEDFAKTIKIDSAIPAKDVTVDFIEALKVLEPFGEGFPRPLFGLTFHSDEIRRMGREENHVKFYDKEAKLSVICWDGANLLKKKPLFSKAIGYPQINEFNGNVSAQFIVQDKILS